jgi:hypothetical protein
MSLRQLWVVPAVVAAVLVPTGTPAVPAPVTFKSTGAEQRYTVPPGVDLVAVRLQGAWGSGVGGGPGHYVSTFAQNPAAWQGLVRVTPGQTLYAEVGSNGVADGGPTFGGGGAAGSPDPEKAEAGSGGGASDIRTCSEYASSCPGGGSSLQSRLIVAGGSGGNGGSAITDAAGLFCGTGTGGGSADNAQPLPKGNAALGPLPIGTANGYVIPGYGSNSDAAVKTQNGDSDAAGGSTVAGRGGSGTRCHGGGAYQAVTFVDSVPGRPGNGPNGGTGGSAAGLKPLPCNTPNLCNDAGPGGGGGGGYFGGGGGVSGFGKCMSAGPGSCNAVTGSMGGGGGSSFIANSVLAPLSVFGMLGTGIPYVEIAPVVEITSPANGAVYPSGRVVHANWSCSTVPGWGLGLQNCTAGAAVGSPIATTPGKHVFTVRGDVGTQPVTVSVSYTVRSSGRS